MEALPLILFSGMGADDGVFEPQLKSFPQLTVPRWIEPLPHESLANYAKRFAAQIDPGVPCFVGGASFGGFVAIEAARHLQTRACFLIGSVRCPSELPLRIRALRKLKHLLPAIPFEWIAPLAGCSVRLRGERMRPVTRKLMNMLDHSKAAYLRWACEAVLTWEPTLPAPAFPVYHIHGHHDLVLPVRRTHADEIVYTGGHILSLTRPLDVNRFLTEKMNTCTTPIDVAAASTIHS
jgi:pimeloyl-ACP methyl ester carboxylesterase